MITKMCVVFLINLDYLKVKVADILKTVGPFEFTSTDLVYAGGSKYVKASNESEKPFPIYWRHKLAKKTYQI